MSHRVFRSEPGSIPRHDDALARCTFDISTNIAKGGIHIQEGEGVRQVPAVYLLPSACPHGELDSLASRYGRIEAVCIGGRLRGDDVL